MSKIGIGDRVVRVTAPKALQPIDAMNGVRYPQKGCVYTVRDVLMSDAGRVHILLHEIRNPALGYDNGFGEHSFFIENFRKVQDTDYSQTIEALKRLVEKNPVKVDA